MESETKAPAADASAPPPPSYTGDGGAPAEKPDLPPDDKAAPTATAATTSATSAAAGPRPGPKPAGGKEGTLSRVMTKKNKELGKKFLSSYGKTWLGLSPIWLLGEALHPSKDVKVGGLFKQSASDFVQTCFQIHDEVALSKDDVVVIIDRHLRTQPHETVGRTAEVLKAAQEHALVVVSTNVTKAKDQITRSAPGIKKTMQTQGRDAIVLVDRQLKNPIVVTGVSKFARSRGIPAPEALLRLASLGLGTIIKEIDKAVEAEKEALAKAEAKAEHVAHEAKEYIVRELDAEELERAATADETRRADEVCREAEQVGHPEVRDSSDVEEDHHDGKHPPARQGGRPEAGKQSEGGKGKPTKGAGKHDDDKCAVM